jgi:hypothetical protein
VRAPKGRAPHRKMRRLVTLRLPAFRFLLLFLEVLIWRSSTDERKAGTTPALSLDRTGFALADDIMPVRDPIAIVRTVKRGRKSAPRDGRAWP